jgi:hypothetical protein
MLPIPRAGRDLGEAVVGDVCGEIRRGRGHTVAIPLARQAIEMPGIASALVEVREPRHAVAEMHVVVVIAGDLAAR